MDKYKNVVTIISDQKTYDPRCTLELVCLVITYWGRYAIFLSAERHTRGLDFVGEVDGQ